MYKITLIIVFVALVIVLILCLTLGGEQSTEQLAKYDIFDDAESAGSNKPSPEEEKHPEFWLTLGREELFKSLAKQKLNVNKAKNIILFMGDGMGLSTITAARILKGQRMNHTGEEAVLSFDKFPYTALSKTYCSNAQVADSACSATAYLSGVKGNIITIGVSAEVTYNNCTASMDPANQVSSIAAWAQRAGKSTGFVTTTPVTHASPAGVYAHTSNRLHECDADLMRYNIDPRKCMDMAQQLITQEPGRNLNVIMGGGLGKLMPNDQRDSHGNYGERRDGKNLVSTWEAMHPQGAFVTNREQLLKVNTSNVSHIMGIFQSKSMKFNAFADETYQPTLSEMTKVALQLLQRNEKGYFVFIEGGLIDSAHHDNRAGLALEETLELDKAVQLARDMTDPSDTLILVTADHSQPMTLAGFPGRGTPILGLNQHERSLDGLKYLTLSYPLGYEQYLDKKGKRMDLEKLNWKIDSKYPSAVKVFKGPHSGEDVSVYASGPFAHLFTGVLQQNTIPIMAAYAACIGNGPTLCDG
uniref:Alkaline phosphatase n=1 Tax=Stomoxys calcitrans TaxID=35570 RepID=A0A1I8PHI3_STOCA